MAHFLESVKLDVSSVAPVDKLIAPCYSECANLSLLLGERAQAESYLRRAYEVAKAFDEAPTKHFDNVKFCIGEKKETVTYDDLGDSVMAAVEKQLSQEGRNPLLHRAWKQMMIEDRIRR